MELEPSSSGLASRQLMMILFETGSCGTFNLTATVPTQCVEILRRLSSLSLEDGFGVTVFKLDALRESEMEKATLSKTDRSMVPQIYRFVKCVTESPCVRFC